MNILIDNEPISKPIKELGNEFDGGRVDYYSGIYYQDKNTVRHFSITAYYKCLDKNSILASKYGFPEIFLAPSISLKWINNDLDFQKKKDVENEILAKFVGKDYIDRLKKLQQYNREHRGEWILRSLMPLLFFAAVVIIGITIIFIIG